MAEHDRHHKTRSKTEQAGENPSKKKLSEKQPSEKKSSEKQSLGKESKSTKPAPQATLQSWDVELSAHSVASLHYWRTMPPSSHAKPPEEPSRHVPVVPSGRRKEDDDDSPPVQFENPDSAAKTGEVCEDAAARDDADAQ